MSRFPAGFIALAVKLGPKLVSVGAKLIKSFKLGKAGLAGASLVTYSYIFSWRFAVALMAMLFVHEYGHVWAMKRCGMRVKGMYFIPLLGAAAVADEEFPSRNDEVFIALMGPLWGLAFSAAIAVPYFVWEAPIWAVMAAWMALINLFNLLPIVPLDGGRIFKSMAFSLHSWLGLFFLVLGLVAAAGVAFYLEHFLFLILLGVGALELASEWSNRHGTLPKMTGAEILGSGMSYVIVAGLLWGLMEKMSSVPGAALARELLVG